MSIFFNTVNHALLSVGCSKRMGQCFFFSICTKCGKTKVVGDLGEVSCGMVEFYTERLYLPFIIKNIAVSESILYYLYLSQRLLNIPLETSFESGHDHVHWRRVKKGLVFSGRGNSWLICHLSTCNTVYNSSED